MGERVCVWLRGERVRGMCGAVRDVGRAHACAHTRAALLEGSVRAIITTSPLACVLNSSLNFWSSTPEQGRARRGEQAARGGGRAPILLPCARWASDGFRRSVCRHCCQKLAGTQRDSQNVNRHWPRACARARAGKEGGGQGATGTMHSCTHQIAEQSAVKRGRAQRHGLLCAVGTMTGGARCALARRFHVAQTSICKV